MTLNPKEAHSGKPRIYTTKEELKNMEKVNVPNIEFIKKFLRELTSLGHARALDVAGGDGRLVKFLLHDDF